VVVIGDYHQRDSKTGKLALALLATAIALTCLLALAVFSAWPVGTLAAILQPTSTSTPTPSNTPTNAPTFTPLPTATPTHTPVPTVSEPQVHQWLGRPFGGGNGNEPDRTYPYGSTAKGKYRIHRGVDFPNPFGTPVFAAAQGRVIVAGTDYRVMRGERVNFYGQLVIIRLDQPYGNQKVYVLYGHLSKVHVRFLQTVNEGDLIGEVGMTGVAIGPHLHLEVRVGRNSYENTRNPELWLRPLPDKGTVVGLLTDSEGGPIAEHPLTLYRSDTPDQRFRDATTYAAADINPDDEWQENFVVGDVPAGDYLVKTYVNGRLYSEEITVRPGEIARVAIEAA
jgi:hypothetical protein